MSQENVEIARRKPGGNGLAPTDVQPASSAGARRLSAARISS